MSHTYFDATKKMRCASASESEFASIFGDFWHYFIPLKMQMFFLRVSGDVSGNFFDFKAIFCSPSRVSEHPQRVLVCVGSKFSVGR